MNRAFMGCSIIFLGSFLGAMEKEVLKPTNKKEMKRFAPWAVNLFTLPFAPQLSLRPQSVKGAEVQGDLFIIPWRPIYMDAQKRALYERKFNRSIAPHEPFVAVWATSEESDNWASHGHRALDKVWPKGGHWTFPIYVPYSLIKNAKEGDKIKFKLLGTAIALTCNTQLYRYWDDGRFEDLREFLIERFKKYPNFEVFSERKLIEEGLIADGGVEERKGFWGTSYQVKRYVHGPKGIDPQKK